MKVLITNDDGIAAPGIRALLESMPDFVKPLVVAPADEKSATSHSISLGQELKVVKISNDAVRKYAVHGTPADCIKFALSEFVDFVPDLIVSGINQGANTGVSVYYSGTISAAREGLINQIPSIAFSLCDHKSRDFKGTQAVAHQLVSDYVTNKFPKDVMLNVNTPPIPKEKIKGIKITKQASSRFIEELIQEKITKKKEVYRLAGEIEVLEADGTSDEEAVAHGFVSVTPLRLDLTDYDSIPYFKSWMEKNPEKIKEAGNE